jgi:hypothetical protein
MAGGCVAPDRSGANLIDACADDARGCLAFPGPNREDRPGMLRRFQQFIVRLQQFVAQWFRPPTTHDLEPPLAPGEAAYKERPGEEPPLAPGEAAYKERPGEEPPLEDDSPREN